MKTTVNQRQLHRVQEICLLGHPYATTVHTVSRHDIVHHITVSGGELELVADYATAYKLPNGMFVWFYELDPGLQSHQQGEFHIQCSATLPPPPKPPLETLITVHAVSECRIQADIHLYCGRPGSCKRSDLTDANLGNPFPMGSEAHRDKVCDLYRDTLRKHPGHAHWPRIHAIGERLLKGQRVALYCFCKPRRCHCDTIREQALRYAHLFEQHATQEQLPAEVVITEDDRIHCPSCYEEYSEADLCTDPGLSIHTRRKPHPSDRCCQCGTPFQS